MPRGTHAPTLGYPSRTAAVEALFAQGLAAPDIVEQIGGTENSIQVLICAARNRTGDRKVLLSREVMDGLGDEAALRGISPSELAGQLLGLIVREDLFEALIGEAGDG